MKNLIFKFSVLALIILPFFSMGQIVSPVQEKCGFDKIHREKLANDPVYLQKTLDFERDLPNMVFDKASATYVIPCVVHVMETGTAMSSITDDQIKDAIKGLNERLRKITGSLGDGNGVDVGIEYALAVRNPSGNCTNGINRIDMSGNATYMNSGVRNASGSGITDAALKAISVWDQTKYYNIWLISEIDNNDGGAGTQGYAYFASSHGTSSDGAVMVINSFKDPTSTTFVHELGHSLNLFHTFEGDDGNNNGVSDQCPATNGCGSGVGDCCGDTPAHKRTIDQAFYFDCVNTTNNSCAAGTTAQDYMHNYMDYASDACQNMLTGNQSTRMQASVAGTRASFLASNGNLALVPVSAATVDFEASKTILCGTGNTVSFTDLSACIPNTFMGETSWSGISFSWTITNGTNTYTSTVQNPTITFSNTGTFDVTLTVTNASGTATLTKTGLVIVSTSPAGACTPSSSNTCNCANTVSNVTFNTINNTTSTSLNAAYTDYSCSANTIVLPGQVYNLAVELYAGGSGREFVEVWIDYDNDGVIDAGESVLTGSTATSSTNSIVSANITIPITATQNTLLRMRVMGETGSTPSASDKNCSGSYFIGDVEDYGVYIYSAPTCTAPAVSGQPSAQTTCQGSNTSFTVTATGTATLSYQWQENNGGGFANISNGGIYSNALTSTLNLTGVTTGMNTYTYRCIVTNGCGTATSNNATFTVNSNVTPSVSIASNDADNSICSGTSVTFTATPTNGGGAPSYQWKLNGSNVGSNSTTYSNSGLVNGDAVTCVMTSNASCPSPTSATSNSIATTVISSVTPSVSIVSNDADNTICTGTSVTFTATPTNGGTPSYQWKLNGGNVGSNSTTYTNAALSNGDVVACVMTSNAACASPSTGTSSNITMTVSSSLTPSVVIASNDADNSICTGTSVTFTATPTNGGTTPAYQWKLNGGNVGSNSATYTNATLGNGDIVSCVMTSNASCLATTTATSNSINTTVLTNLTPSISISSNDADNSFCPGTNVTFTATPTNGGTTPAYQWKLNGSNVGSNSTTYANTTLANGDVVTCVLTSNEACVTSSTATSAGITQTVLANVTPIITITSDDTDNTICTGSTVNFTTSITNGGTLPSYQWKINGSFITTGSTYSHSTFADGDVITCELTSNAICASPTLVASNSISMNVVANLTPSILIVSDDADNTICPGTTVNFAATPTNGGSSPTYDWKLNGLSVGSGSTYTNSGLVDLDAITCDMISNDACASPTNASSNSINISVTNNLVPAITIVSDDADNSFCVGTTVTFTSSINNGGTSPSYQWKINGGDALGETSSTFVTSSLVNGDIVSCQLISNDPCATPTTVQSNNINMTVTATVTPTLSISSDDADNTICSGTSVTFTATPTNGGTTPTYDWKINGLSVASGATFVTSSLANNDVVTAILTSNDACASPLTANSATITMTVTSSLVPAITIASDDLDNTICNGTNVTFTATPVNGGTSPVFDWKLNGLSVGSGSTYSNSALADLDIVTCDLTSNDACASPLNASSNSITISIVNNLTPGVSISSDDADNAICSGTNVTFTATANNGGSSPAYQWKLNGANVGSNSNSYSNALLANGDIVSCDLTSNDPCANPVTASSNAITLTVNAVSTPSVSVISDDADNIICSGATVIFTCNVTNGGTTPTYQWKLNGSTIGGETNSTYVTSSLSNTDQISCDIISSDACSSPITASSASLTFTVNANPTISIGVLTNTSTCGNTDGSIEILGAGTGTISWTGTASGSIPATLPFVVPNFSSGTYNLTFSDGCSSNIVTGSIIDPGAPVTPTITANGPTTFCDGGSINLTSSNGTNITWSTGETTSTITVSVGGDYFVTKTNASGCSSISSILTVVVNTTPTPAVITASGPSTFCTGGSVTLTSDLASGNVWSTGATTQTITVSTPGNYSITTTLGACTSLSNVIPVVVNNAVNIILGGVTDPSSCGGSDGQIEILGSGNGTVTWTGTTSGSQNAILPIILQNFSAGTYDLTFNNGCNSNTVSATVNDLGVPAAPTISAQGATTFCEGGSVILSSSTANGNDWSTGETSQSITVNASGTYTTTVSSAPGCSATSNSITVTVNPTPTTPTINAGGSTSFCQGGSVNLTSSSATGNNWTNGAGSNQTITVSSSGNYSVSVTQNGCVSAASTPITVTVSPIPLTPSISTSGPLSFCQGQNVVLTSDITSGIQWSTGASTASITVNTNDVITVTNTVNGCSAVSDPVTTTVNPVPNPSISAIADVCDTANVFTLNQGSPAGGTYTVDNNAATTFTPSFGAIGNHAVVYSLTQNGCTGTASTTFNVINCSGNSIDENSLSIQLYPNPTNGMIEIKGIDKNEIKTIEVYDQVGKLIVSVQNDNQVNLSNYANGMYNLVIKTNAFESQQKVQLIR